MRTVYACSLNFPVPMDAIWSEAVNWIEGWYHSKFPEIMLPSDWASNTTEAPSILHNHSLRTRFETDQADTVLNEIRWCHPDTGDPSLIWSIEISVFGKLNQTFFSLILRIASAELDAPSGQFPDGAFALSPVDYRLAPPRLIKNLVDRGDARMGNDLMSSKPRVIEANDVGAFVEELLLPTRRTPILVASPNPLSENYSIDSDIVAKDLTGVANVVVLGSKWAAFALTDELGKQYSCFNGAVRIYWPHFTREANPFFHRLWMPSNIEKFKGSENFGRGLLRFISAAASFRFVEPEQIRLFRVEREKARIDALKNQKTLSFDQLYEEWVISDKKATDLEDQIADLRGENENLRANLAALTYKSSYESQPAPEEVTEECPQPDTVLDAVVEAQKKTANLTFLDSAFSSAKDSPFKQPSKALSALMAIDDVAKAWINHLNGAPAPGPRKDAFSSRGFDYKDDISQTAQGKWGAQYEYMYEGAKKLFAPHITIGAKQPEKCLSIHMFWDEKNKVVVIAHVGRHKANTTS